MPYANGRLPASALTAIPGGRLRKGTPARSWLAMRYYIGRKTGTWLIPSGPMSSYRTIQQQQELWRRYTNGTGAIAARPGTSNHGSATSAAVDIPTPAMQAAVRQYGYLFGWGILGGRIPSDSTSEAWHCRLNVQRLTPRARLWYWRYRVVKRSKR
jgi:hypothetical protein